ncbi:hypothetical protein MT325_M124L [Paramecium bursaria chlorella virus MT325]|uniref:Uncharacterized protein M124L n=1 Tax=Paramecium bursaria Chlorella virus MT325 TaxID=346932 RepID=A7ITK4_PBCVM|nr:hypothetical protein MT325_M124L [Paramecium bursaria chlorella virus MT325]
MTSPAFQTVDLEANVGRVENTLPMNPVVLKSRKLMYNILAVGIVLLISIAIAVPLGILLSKPKPMPPQPSGPILSDPSPFEPKEGFTPLWWDEFNGVELDREKWHVQPDVVDYYGGNRQIQHYIDSPSTVSVANGSLHIIADNPGKVVYNESYPNYNDTYYTSARINTKGRGGQWYPGMELNGTVWNTIRIEARLKAPRGPGVVGAFWMLTTDYVCDMEIDLFETPDCTYTTYGLWYANETAGLGRSKHGNSVSADYDKFCSEYVTYAIEWNQEYITYFVDSVNPVFTTGRSTWEGRCNASDPVSPYNKSAYLILNTAIGSFWGGVPSNDIFPAIMKVDYVRVSGSTA